jgi:hypothetical protein
MQELGPLLNVSERCAFYNLVNDLHLGDVEMVTVKWFDKGVSGSFRCPWDYVQADIDPTFITSWALILATPCAHEPSLFFGTRDMLHLAIDHASQEGLVLEFGVQHGRSLLTIASRFSETQVHGFDTFEGLPEA